MPDYVVEKTISAKEARNMAEQNTWLLNHMYKEIRYAAGQNKAQIRWDINEVDAQALQNAIDELIKQGFQILRNDEDEHEIIIKW